MNTKAKPMSVPDIGGLLGKISEKRDELPKTERQHVVTAPDAEKHVNDKIENQKNVKTEKRLNEQAEKQKNDYSNSQKNGKTEERKNKKTGRPTLKNEDIEYVRLGCNIPKTLRQKAGDAINHEKFKTPEGKPIKTLDELVSLAMAQLLK